MANNSKINFKNPPELRGIFYFKCILFFTILSLNLQLQAQAKIKFKDAKKSFGIVKKGEMVNIEYDFINEGDQPLLIADAKFECSCTSVDFPKQPIAPGQKGKLTVIFNTKTVYERQDRNVEIISNAKNSPETIRFKGFVVSK